jgi:hypothetical protein
MELSKMKPPIKPLDFVRPIRYPEAIGMITEIGSFTNTKGGTTYQASIEWLDKGNHYLPTAWWQHQELEVVDNLSRLLSRSTVHPFGNGKEYIDECYPKNPE